MGSHPMVTCSRSTGSVLRQQRRGANRPQSPKKAQPYSRGMMRTVSPALVVLQTWDLGVPWVFLEYGWEDIPKAHRTAWWGRRGRKGGWTNARDSATPPTSQPRNAGQDARASPERVPPPWTRLEPQQLEHPGGNPHSSRCLPQVVGSPLEPLCPPFPPSFSHAGPSLAAPTRLREWPRRRAAAGSRAARRCVRAWRTCVSLRSASIW